MQYIKIPVLKAGPGVVSKAVAAIYLEIHSMFSCKHCLVPAFLGTSRAAQDEEQLVFVDFTIQTHACGRFFA